MAQFRKEELVNEQYYHIYSRSIAKFVIFNNVEEYDRFVQLINAYRFSDFTHKYSKYIQLSNEMQKEILNNCISQNNRLVTIVAYCLMPTHIHLVLRQEVDGGIVKYMSKVLNGYSRYFNTRHKRTGPLWSGRFRSVLVAKDEQLLHLTRYIHLNPVSAGLVDMPLDWAYSSYIEYVNKNVDQCLCNYDNVIDMTKNQYIEFVEEHKDYQKALSLIKHLTIENYSG